MFVNWLWVVVLCAIVTGGLFYCRLSCWCCFCCGYFDLFGVALVFVLISMLRWVWFDLICNTIV